MEEPTLKARKACLYWLHFCLSIGWSRDVLDDLEALWWKHHDRHGRLTP